MKNTTLNIVIYRGFLKYANYIHNDVVNEMSDLEKEREVIRYNEISNKYKYLKEAISKVDSDLNLDTKISYERLAEKMDNLLKNKKVRKYIKLEETKNALDTLMQLCMEKEEDLEREKCNHPIWYFDKTNNPDEISIEATCPKCGKQIRVAKTNFNDEFIDTVRHSNTVAILYELNKKTGKRYVTHGFSKTNKSLNEIEEEFLEPRVREGRLVKTLIKKN